MSFSSKSWGYEEDKRNFYLRTKESTIAEQKDALEVEIWGLEKNKNDCYDA